MLPTPDKKNSSMTGPRGTGSWTSKPSIPNPKLSGVEANGPVTVGRATANGVTSSAAAVAAGAITASADALASARFRRIARKDRVRSSLRGMDSSSRSSAIGGYPAHDAAEYGSRPTGRSLHRREIIAPGTAVIASAICGAICSGCVMNSFGGCAPQPHHGHGGPRVLVGLPNTRAPYPGMRNQLVPETSVGTRLDPEREEPGRCEGSAVRQVVEADRQTAVEVLARRIEQTGAEERREAIADP